jgi:hypothetical protein
VSCRGLIDFVIPQKGLDMSPQKFCETERIPCCAARKSEKGEEVPTPRAPSVAWREGSQSSQSANHQGEVAQRLEQAYSDGFAKYR